MLGSMIAKIKAVMWTGLLLTGASAALTAIAATQEAQSVELFAGVTLATLATTIATTLAGYAKRQAPGDPMKVE